MGRVRAVALACCLALLPAAVRAQAPPLASRPLTLSPPSALTRLEREELASWLDAIRKWQRFDKQCTTPSPTTRSGASFGVAAGP